MLRPIFRTPTTRINRAIIVSSQLPVSVISSGLLLTTKIQYQVLQNAKRLNSFSIPQEQEIKHIDNGVFNEAVLGKLIRIEAAFRQIYESPMNDTNPIKITSIKKNGLYSLQIITNRGSFLFEGFDDLSTLYYTSPVSGVYKYFYGQQQQRFLNNKDRHILDECLTREVLEKFGVVLQL